MKNTKLKVGNPLRFLSFIIILRQIICQAHGNWLIFKRGALTHQPKGGADAKENCCLPIASSNWGCSQQSDAVFYLCACKLPRAMAILRLPLALIMRGWVNKILFAGLVRQISYYLLQLNFFLKIIKPKFFLFYYGPFPLVDSTWWEQWY